ncbi:MAG TPA: NHL repeat-containing protein, partial [Candidatus Ozemobacteraceae bacterium]|nr:NHL repeat-containing protein [Candidatus Ozemobacteraceae bacterium]
MKQFCRTFLALLLVLHAGAGFSVEFSTFQARGYEGRGPGEFIGPEDLILGPSGEIVVADSRNNRVQVLSSAGIFQRMIWLRQETPGVASYISDLEKSLASGTAKSVAGTKKDDAEEQVGKKSDRAERIRLPNGTSISMDKPSGLALDSQGRLFVACPGSNQILIFRLTDGVFLGMFSRPGRMQGTLDGPIDIDVRQDGLLAVAESTAKRVQIFNPDGSFVRELLYKEETPKRGLQSLVPRGVFWMPGGELLVSYPTFNQVVAWDMKGNIVWRYGVKGSGKGELSEPSFFCHGPEGHVFVSDSGNHRIVEITPMGLFVKNFAMGRGSSPGRLLRPGGIAFTSADSLFVADTGNNRVQIFTPSRAALILKDAKELTMKDRWDEALPRIEQVLTLEPNDAEA